MGSASDEVNFTFFLILMNLSRDLWLVIVVSDSVVCRR